MTRHVTSLIAIACGAVVLTVGDLFMRKWVMTLDSRLYAVGLGIWFIGLLFLARSLRGESIAVASDMMVVLNVIMLILVSALVYKERFGPMALSGMMLGIVAVSLMVYGTA